MATSDKLNYLKQTKEEIKNAIVAKGGTIADGATFRSYKDAIAAIETGGGSAELPEEALNISGDCTNRFFNANYDWLISEYGSKIKTNNITNLESTFQNSKLESIPFELNCDSSTAIAMDYCFSSCVNLTTVPKINNCKPKTMKSFFTGCKNLKEVPADFVSWFNWSYIENLTGTSDGGGDRFFSGCTNLRSVPVELFSHFNKKSGYSASYFNGGFSSCAILDELINLPLHYTGTWTSNAFGSTFLSCYRLKNVTFALQEDGTPYVMKWSKQTIDLSSNAGYVTNNTVITINTDITADKEVTDAESYERLKNDPDWFTERIAYSRYNKESAIATIQSLPDCSATGGNTIKFRAAAGELTDGGKIGDLDAEIIALAASRGWTVTMV